ncbi:MAG: DUF4178 domain-containing protein [Planctomycetes bacterium]|nr:DUF4178 domain-containing protein [Planctomycetota bacterium]
MRPQTAPQLKSFQCRSCGGSIQLRTPQAHHVACPFCASIVDARHPEFLLIQQFQGKLAFKPLLPPGKRVKIRGEEYESIGYLRRTVTIEGTNYTWEEYLLYHPHRGYRWLAQYGGHWNYIKACTGVPKVRGDEAQYLDLRFKKFQSAEARVTFALGEFFWEVKRGEKAAVVDWVSPPYVLSSEKTEGEIAWSIGEYIRPEDVWKGFALEGAPPGQVGVGPSQPSPYEAARRPMRWTFWILLVLLVVGQFVFVGAAKNGVVHTERLAWTGAEADRAKVSGIFEVPAGSSNVEIELDAAGLSNNWAYLKLALIHAETHEAYDFAKEVSYYSGSDSDGPWTESELRKKAFAPSVPGGRYYLWIDPEFGVAPKPAGPGPPGTAPFTVSVAVYRDVPRWGPFFLALPLLLFPYWFYLWRRRSFEYRRWIESDYPMPPLVKMQSGDSDE